MSSALFEISLSPMLADQVEPLMSAQVETLPMGFTPFGFEAEVPAVDPVDIPQSMNELEELRSSTYDLTVQRAGELNIPVVGSVSGGFERRVVVYEWTRFKRVYGQDGVEYRYGFVIRFCLTVNRWNVASKISLPFLSAQAELGNIQASWVMQVRGLVGPKVDAVVLPPSELKVETFVLASQSLAKAVEAINAESTRFIPGVLLSKVEPEGTEQQIWQAAVKTFGVHQVSRGRSRNRAQQRLGVSDPDALTILNEIYDYFGIPDSQAEPEAGARERARSLLRGIRADT